MSFTYDEIMSQPQAWAATLAAIEQQWSSLAPLQQLPANSQVLFIGCGTSFYLAQSAAQCFQELTGLRSVAVPASEILLAPAATIPVRAPVLAFVISRSGNTSEAVLAAEHLRREHAGQATVVAVTCNAEGALTRTADLALVLPHAAEHSVVMTRSFTSMLLALQSLAARVAGNSDLLAELASLPGALEHNLPAWERVAREVGEDLGYQQVIYLGLGAYSGLAEEATLKLKEMTQTPCEAYNPLEFRHGPISILEKSTLVVLLAGERGARYLHDVEADIKQHGSSLMVLATYDSPRADVRLAVPAQLSDLARCVLYLPPLQLIAYYRALRLGLNPDQPRHLTQVVRLRDLSEAG